MLLLVKIFLLISGTALLFRVLHFRFDLKITIIATLVMLGGTNFLVTVFHDDSSVHLILFVLYLILIFLSEHWSRQKKWIFLWPMLPVMTVISFLSPPGISLIAFPIMMGFNSKHSISQQVERYVDQFVFLIFILIFCISMQDVPWFHQTGRDVYYGMNHKPELSWSPMYINRLLFSSENGWITYTPVVALAIAGFWFLAEKYRRLFTATFLVFLVFTVYAASDPVWTFPYTFGYPTLAEIYGILAFPLAALISAAFSKGNIAKIMLVIVMGFLIIFNILQTCQLRPSLPQMANLPQDSIPEALKPQYKRLAFYDFEGTLSDRDAYRSEKYSHSGKWSFALGNPPGFSPGLWMKMNETDSLHPAWISVTAYIYFTCVSRENEVLLVITGNRKDLAFKYRTTDLSDSRFYPGLWNKVSMTYLLPSPTEAGDALQVYFWNRGKQICYLDDLEITLHQEGIKP